MSSKKAKPPSQFRADVGNRMKIAINVKQIRLAEARRRLKLPQNSSLSGWLRGSLTVDDIDKFVTTFQVNPIWLLYGVGDFDWTPPTKN